MAAAERGLQRDQNGVIEGGGLALDDFLRHLDELERWHQAAARMLPPHQCLVAGGGTLAVPTLTLFSYPIRQAVGTSAGLGLFIAIPATLGFVIGGWGQASLPPLSLMRSARVSMT